MAAGAHDGGPATGFLAVNDPSHEGALPPEVLDMPRQERPLSQLLVLFGMTGFAFSQPVLGVLGNNPTVFRNNGIEGVWIVAYAIGLAGFPPLLLWAALNGARKAHPRTAHVSFSVVLGALSAIAVVQFAKSAGLQSGPALSALAAVVGFGFPLCYARFSPVAMWARFSSTLPAFAVGLFLFASPTGELVRASSDARTERSSELPSVVMLVLDEFPTAAILDADGQVDDDRFPNLAAFGNDASWYRHFTTLSPFTGSAVPSLLSGQFPRADRPFWSHHPDTIFSLLEPTHDIAAFESATALCGVDGCSSGADVEVDLGEVLDVTADIFRARVSFGNERPAILDEFEERAASIEQARGEGGSLFDLIGGSELAAIPARFEQFLQSLAPEEAPTLRYLHLLLPHSPWLLYDDGTRYRHADELGVHLPRADRTFLDRWSLWPSTVTEQRFLLQATYTDSLIGLMIDQLRSAGMYDESLVVIVADHGVSFGPRTSSREAVDSSLDEIAYVPLFIKAPNQHRGIVDDTNIMAVDLLPTLAQIVGATADWEVDGFPVGSPAIADRGDRKLWYDFRDAFSPELHGTFEFSDIDHFPDAARRLVPPLTDPRDELSAMLSTLNIDDVFGKDLDDLNPETRDSGELVRLDQLDDLQMPPPDEPPILVITGRLEGVPWAVRGSVFVLEVNDEVVTGSRVSVDSNGELHIMALLRPDALTSDNDIRAALVTVLGVVELEVTS